MPAHNLDGMCSNTIRTLAMDAVQTANSGHPGTPIAPTNVEARLLRPNEQREPTVEHPRDLRVPRPAVRINSPEVHSPEATGNESQDMEELSLRLYRGEMRDLEEAARQEGVTAASLARYLVREYLLWTGSELGKALGYKQRRLGRGSS